MKRPSFQFYPGDWQSNSNLRRCTHEEKGIWIDVLCLFHDQNSYGIVRWNVKEIAQAIGCSYRKISGLVSKGILKGCDAGETCEELVFVPRHGRTDGSAVTLIAAQEGPIWYSSRMVIDEYKRASRSGELSSPDPSPDPSPDLSPKGGIGAAPKGTSNPSPDLSPDPSPDPSPSRAGSSSSSSSSSSTSKSKSKSEDMSALTAQTAPVESRIAPKIRGSTLPADWFLPTEWGEWALSEKPDWSIVDVKKVAEKFKDHWLANANQARSKKLDWCRAWRNWVRNEHDIRSSKNQKFDGLTFINEERKARLRNEKIIDL